MKNNITIIEESEFIPISNFLIYNFKIYYYKNNRKLIFNNYNSNNIIFLKIKLIITKLI